ncbi:hypothetical protein SNE40_018335 [Patella caerulea]|uniref:Uncharacterized protein n=1 Tax=Patella caerulea TaxID=87958 RepID=A0AAN8PAP4_PATCE
MSFLGSIGHLMDSSGLNKVLEEVYGENAVIHMLNGKSYARAIRGHFLVDSELNALVISDEYALPLEVPEENTIIPAEIEKVIELFDRMVSNESSSDEAISSCGDAIQKVQQRIENRKTILKEKPMGELWVQYMTMVDLLRTFIHSERTGNWKLNLWCLSEMVYYFAATGHRNYAKSVQIFLQDMMELEKNNPVIYSMFDMGLFVIRRSNRFWAGLPKDLVNEHTLMRCMKWSGGLTRGRGIMHESQRNRWLLALPICSAVSGSMQELTNLRYETSDQHKEVSPSRIERDNNDAHKILQFLVQNNPFQPSLDMHNLITGEKSEPSLNCHKSYEVGCSIMENAYGNDAYEHSFRKKNEIITMGTAKKGTYRRRISSHR